MKSMLAIALLLSLTAGFARAGEATIAVASNFSSTMTAILIEFEQATGHKIKMATGASGKLYAQIENGAPFQAFFSADQVTATALSKNGLALAESQFTYAIGQLVLWSATPGLVDDQGMILRQDSNKKIALANAKVAPYGMAAVNTLQNLNIERQTKHRLVQGENIAQTYQFVATGNAELGFVALSQLSDKNHKVRGSFWIIPKHLYKPIRQDAVILIGGENSEAIEELMQFFKGKKARTIIQAYGYKTAMP